MKRSIYVFLLAVLSLSVLSAGGQEEADTTAGSPVRVFVSILPQKYFAERIGGEKVEVSVMVPPGKSPATYEPTPRQMVALGEADIFFTIGVPFEAAFLDNVSSSLKSLRIVPTDEGITKRHLEAHSHDEHGHEDEHDHEEAEEAHEHEMGAPDPHVWMDPLLVKQQSAVMRDALIEQDPDNADFYRDQYQSFAADLDSLHEELTELLAPAKGSLLFVYHPAFGYFADRYGLRQEAIETGGKEPTPALLEEVIAEAREENVKVIFVQPEFPETSAQAVADAIGGVVVPVVPLAENYVENLHTVAGQIAEGLAK